MAGIWSSPVSFSRNHLRRSIGFDLRRPKSNPLNFRYLVISGPKKEEKDVKPQTKKQTRKRPLRPRLSWVSSSDSGDEGNKDELPDGKKAVGKKKTEPDGKLPK
jgi:hypothetical protein